MKTSSCAYFARHYLTSFFSQTFRPSKVKIYQPEWSWMKTYGLFIASKKMFSGFLPLLTTVRLTPQVFRNTKKVELKQIVHAYGSGTAEREGKETSPHVPLIMVTKLGGLNLSEIICVIQTERARSVSSIWSHRYDFRPKLHDTKFNYQLIIAILNHFFYEQKIMLFS